jgi:hypothetical protein
VNPEIFITAIVTILMHYPVKVVEEVVDPFFGLPSKLKYPPTPYDVRQACEEVATREYRIARALARPMVPYIPHSARPPDPKPNPESGVHPPGTILSDYVEAVRLYGKPLEKERQG